MLYSVFSPFLTQETKSKFLFVKRGILQRHFKSKLVSQIKIPFIGRAKYLFCCSNLYVYYVKQFSLLYILNYNISRMVIKFCSYTRYIMPEEVSVQYGRLSRPGDSESDPPKPASEFTINGGEKVNIQIEGPEVM